MNKSQAAWNDRYTKADERLFGAAPTAFVREIAGRPDFDAKSALFLADGDGRNSGWLASRGVAVTAVDFSQVAVDQALGHDQHAGVSVERVASDILKWPDLQCRTWEAVFLVFLQSSSPVRREAARLAGAATASNGWLVIEGFSKEQANIPDMGPNDGTKLWSLRELVDWLPDLRLIEASAGQMSLEDGPRHRGLAHVLRYAARREPDL